MESETGPEAKQGQINKTTNAVYFINPVFITQTVHFLRPLTMSQRMANYRKPRFLRPGCIAPLLEDIERRKTKR